MFILRSGLCPLHSSFQYRKQTCWVYGFLNRGNFVKTTGKNIARVKDFNRANVNKFFDLLESLYNKHHFSSNNIYNIGITTVPNKPSKVLALREKKQVEFLSSAERGIFVTVELCISAASRVMPPLFVFPPKRQNDASPESYAVYHESGWIQNESFIIWSKNLLILPIHRHKRLCFYC